MSSLLALAASGLFVYIAFKNKPSVESFQMFFQNEYLSGDRCKPKGWLSSMVDSLLSPSTAVPPTAIYDCVIFHVAVVKFREQTNGYFLGAFNSWYRILAPNGKAVEQARPSQSMISQYEALRNEANRLKASRDFLNAASQFEQAARLAEVHEQAESYEHAAQCNKLANQRENSYRCYQHAIECCRALKRPAKAAQLADAMIDVASNQLEALKQAEELYDQADDRRASQIRERLGNLLAAEGQFDKASQYFLQRANELASDQVLLFSARKNSMLAFCCEHIANQKHVAEFPDWFVGSQEHRDFDKWLRYQEGEADTFECNLDLPPWLLSIKPEQSFR